MMVDPNIEFRKEWRSAKTIRDKLLALFSYLGYVFPFGFPFH